MSAPQRSHAEVGRQAPTRLIALIVACAMFMAQLDTSVVMLALPEMARSFDTRPVDLSIGITVYLLVQAVFLPSSNWLADRFGARTVFASALAGFTCASVLCAFSQDVPQFVAARALQGLAAAWMTPVGRIVLLQSTPKQELVGVMTITTVPMLIAPTLGPPLGGFITTYLSWPWIFLLNVPFGIAGTWLVLRFISKNVPPVHRPFDKVGFIATALAISSVLFGLDRISADAAHWAGPALLILAGLAIGTFAVKHALRHPHPIISLASVRVPTYSIATIGGGAFVRLPMRALPFVLPLLFQLVFELTAFQTGLLMLALNGGDLLLKPITTFTLRRFGFRDAMFVTALLSVASIVGCAFFAPSTPMWLIASVLLASGMFRSVLLTGLGSLAFADVPQAEIGSASNLWNVVIQVTNALAVSLCVIVLNLSADVMGRSAAELTLFDFRIVLGVLAVIGLVAAMSFRRLQPDAGAQVSGHRVSAKQV